MIPRHVMDVFVHQVQSDGIWVEIGAYGPGLFVAIVAWCSGQDRRAQRLHRDLADGSCLEHLEGHAKRALVRDVGPPDPRVPAEAAALGVGDVLDLSRVDSSIAFAQGQTVPHPASMIEARQPHEINAHAAVLAAGTVRVLAVRIDNQIPVETAEREVVGLQLARLRLAGREYRRRHSDLGHVYRPHVRHGQFQLELAVCIGKITAVEICHGDVAAVALGRRLVSELDTLARKTLVHGEVFSIQQREREVHVYAEVSWRATPYQVHAQDLEKIKLDNSEIRYFSLYHKYIYFSR